jgi:hypothetical protein
MNLYRVRGPADNIKEEESQLTVSALGQTSDVNRPRPAAAPPQAPARPQLVGYPAAPACQLVCPDLEGNRGQPIRAANHAVD